MSHVLMAAAVFETAGLPMVLWCWPLPPRWWTVALLGVGCVLFWLAL